jgi:hypothetical protein
MRPAAGRAALGVGTVLLLLWCPIGRTEVLMKWTRPYADRL